jgi:hypothetical protein
MRIPRRDEPARAEDKTGENRGNREQSGKE